MKNHELILFFIMAYAFSWIIFIALIIERRGWANWQLPFWLHYLAAFGPLLSALVVSGVGRGCEGVRQLFSRMIRWQVRLPYAIFAFFSPVALLIASMLIVRLLEGFWIDVRALGHVSYLPYLGWLVLPLWLVTYGFGEESGWRGFALPRLQQRMSVSRATLVLGVLWAFWHVPAFFYHENFSGMNWLMLPGFVFGILCGSLLLTWLYNGTQGSILMVAVWHALFDLLSASQSGTDLIAVVSTAGVIIWALIAANTQREWGLRFQEKQVEP